MDTADLADLEIQNYLANCMRKLKTIKPLRPKGECHNCQDIVADKKLFCDISCQQDYEFRMARSKQ